MSVKLSSVDILRVPLSEIRIVLQSGNHYSAACTERETRCTANHGVDDSTLKGKIW